MTRRDANAPVAMSQLHQDFLDELAQADQKAAHLQKPQDKVLTAPQWSKALGQAAGKCETIGQDPTTIDGKPRVQR